MRLNPNATRASRKGSERKSLADEAKHKPREAGKEMAMNRRPTVDEVEDARYARDDADRRADAAWETWRQDMDNTEARADYEAARKMYEEDQARYSALYRLAHPGDDGQ